MRGDDGQAGSIELLAGALLFVLFVLLIAQVAMLWRAKNVVEHTAASLARELAAGTLDCAGAPARGAELAARFGRGWVGEVVVVECVADARSRVHVSAVGVRFLPGVSSRVEAVGTATAGRP